MMTMFRPFAACSLFAAAVGIAFAQDTATEKRVEPRPEQQSPDKRDADNQNPNRNPNQPRTQVQTKQQQGRLDQKQGHRGAIDRYTASCLTNENQNEITISQLAQQKATHQDVKAFAEMMVKDHTAFLEKVRRFDTSVRRAAGANDRRDTTGEKIRERAADTVRGAANNAARNAEQDVGSDGTHPANPRGELAQNETERRAFRGPVGQGEGSIPVHMLIQISDEIAKRCLATAQKELQAKSGEEFDRCYIGMQLGAHAKMVDSLSVVQNHVSPEFQQVLSEGLETSQRHLTEAKRLMEQLEKSRDSQTAGADKNPRRQ